MAKKVRNSKSKLNPKSPSRNPSLENLRDLEKAVGNFMEYWGFKNIHGRIWAHLFTSRVPLDSLELMNRLGVSKGLMSLAIRDLQKYEVIQVDHIGKHGSVAFVANQDLFKVITNVLRMRELKMLEEAEKACESLYTLREQDIERLNLNLERIHSVKELIKDSQNLLQMLILQNQLPTCQQEQQ